MSYFKLQTKDDGNHKLLRYGHPPRVLGELGRVLICFALRNAFHGKDRKTATRYTIQDKVFGPGFGLYTVFFFIFSKRYTYSSKRHEVQDCIEIADEIIAQVQNVREGTHNRMRRPALQKLNRILDLLDDVVI